MVFASILLKRVLIDDQGATAIEYGLIVSLIVIAMIAALQGFANSAIAMWTDVDESVDEAINNS